MDNSLSEMNQFDSPNARGSGRDALGEGEFNEGKWSDEEHVKFLEGLTIYGKNWNKIQRYIQTRSCP